MAAIKKNALQTVPAILEVAAFPIAGVTALLSDNSNAAAVIADIEGKVSSWTRIASVVDMALTVNKADGLVKAEADDTGTVYSGSRASIKVTGNWFEVGDLDALSVLLGEAYTSVAASPIAVTGEAKGTGWTVGQPIKLTNKDGDNTIVASIVVKEDSVALNLTTDYTTYVGNGTNGELGYTYIVPVTAQTGVITVDYSYTPSATRYSGMNTDFREVPRLLVKITTVADENGDVDTQYLSDAISSGDVVRSFVDSARAGEVKNTPFEIMVNNGGFHVSKVERF